jgi:hypothetical protein
MKSHNPAALTDRERCYPNWNEAVLAEGQPELGMTENLKEEPSIASRVKQLVSRRPAERESAEHKGSSVKSELLLAAFALFPDELDGFDLFQPALADAEGRQGWGEGVVNRISLTTRGGRWLNCGAKFHGPRISSGQKKTLSYQQDQSSARMYPTGEPPRENQSVFQKCSKRPCH